MHVGSSRQEDSILSEPPNQGVLLYFITEVIDVDYGIKLPWYSELEFLSKFYPPFSLTSFNLR